MSLDRSLDDIIESSWDGNGKSKGGRGKGKGKSKARVMLDDDFDDFEYQGRGQSRKGGSNGWDSKGKRGKGKGKGKGRSFKGDWEDEDDMDLDMGSAGGRGGSIPYWMEHDDRDGDEEEEMPTRKGIAKGFGRADRWNREEDPWSSGTKGKGSKGAWGTPRGGKGAFRDVWDAPRGGKGAFGDAWDPWDAPRGGKGAFGDVWDVPRGGKGSFREVWDAPRGGKGVFGAVLGRSVMVAPAKERGYAVDRGTFKRVEEQPDFKASKAAGLGYGASATMAGQKRGRTELKKRDEEEESEDEEEDEEDEEEEEEEEVKPPPRKKAATTETKSSGSKSIKVTNIPKSLSSADIKEAFESEAGKIKTCDLSKGTARITFQKAKDAQKAVDTFDKGELNGKVISVTLQK